MSKDKNDKELKLFQENLDNMIDDVIKNKKDSDDKKDKSKKDKEPIDATEGASLTSVAPIEVLTQLTKIIDITKKMVETDEFKNLPKEKQILILKQLNLLKEASKELKKEVDKEKEKEKSEKERKDLELTKAAKEVNEEKSQSKGIFDCLIPKGIKELEAKIGNKGKYNKILEKLKKSHLEQNKFVGSPDYTPNRRGVEIQKNIDFVVSPILKKQ
jgi:hypothetical protein